MSQTVCHDVERSYGSDIREMETFNCHSTTTAVLSYRQKATERQYVDAGGEHKIWCTPGNHDPAASGTARTDMTGAQGDDVCALNADIAAVQPESTHAMQMNEIGCPVVHTRDT